MIPKRRHWLSLAVPLGALAVLAGAHAVPHRGTEVEAHGQATVPTCEGGTLADVQPAEAVVLRLRDRQARIFIETLAGASPPSETVAAIADGAAVLSSPDVLGGIVALALRAECVLGHMFVSPLALIDATTVVELYEQRPELRSSEHLDEAALQKLADAGEPAAEFHTGFVRALARGSPTDRAQSIDWLRRSAAHGHGAGMLALGMALAGPGVIQDESQTVGEPPRRDEWTDLAQSCYWLRRAVRAEDPWIPNLARITFDAKVAPRMTNDETQRCLSSLKERSEAPE